MEPVSRTVDTGGGRVHLLDFGGQGRPIVLVHGLGGSAINWLAVGPRLSSLGRTMAIDLVGFGRTPPEGRGANLSANRELVHAFLTKVVGEPAVLIGNSMGGMVSILAAAASPDLVRGLALIDPSVPLAPKVKVDPQVRRQFLVNLIDFGMNPQAAVEAPRVATASHPDSFDPHPYHPGLLRVEAQIDPDVLAGLEARGHELERWPAIHKPGRIPGSVCAVLVDREHGVLMGAADPRDMAYAIGW